MVSRLPWLAWLAWLLGLVVLAPLAAHSGGMRRAQQWEKKENHNFTVKTTSLWGLARG